MHHTYLLIFLLMHVLGDFYIQTNQIAEQKEAHYKSVIQHSIMYLGTAFLCGVPFWSSELVWGIVILGLSHFLIDSLKYCGMKKRQKKIVSEEQQLSIYMLDQIAHICCIIGLSFYMMYHNMNLAVLPILKSMVEILQIDLSTILKILLAIMLVCKPANITIKMILSVYKPEEKEMQKPNAKQAGRLIGTLERLIMITLMSIGQYSAIGFVLTAKSIARYSKISDEPRFAEYYLVGTLLSMLIVLCVYQIVILL